MWNKNNTPKVQIPRRHPYPDYGVIWLFVWEKTYYTKLCYFNNPFAFFIFSCEVFFVEILGCSTDYTNHFRRKPFFYCQIHSARFPVLLYDFIGWYLVLIFTIDDNSWVLWDLASIPRPEKLHTTFWQAAVSSSSSNGTRIFTRLEDSPR